MHRCRASCAGRCNEARKATSWSFTTPATAKLPFHHALCDVVHVLVVCVPSSIVNCEYSCRRLFALAVTPSCGAQHHGTYAATCIQQLQLHMMPICRPPALLVRARRCSPAMGHHHHPLPDHYHHRCLCFVSRLQTTSTCRHRCVLSSLISRTHVAQQDALRTLLPDSPANTTAVDCSLERDIIRGSWEPATTEGPSSTSVRLSQFCATSACTNNTAQRFEEAVAVYTDMGYEREEVCIALTVYGLDVSHQDKVRQACCLLFTHGYSGGGVCQAVQHIEEHGLCPSAHRWRTLAF